MLALKRNMLSVKNLSFSSNEDDPEIPWSATDKCEPVTMRCLRSLDFNLDEGVDGIKEGLASEGCTLSAVSLRILEL